MADASIITPDESTQTHPHTHDPPSKTRTGPKKARAFPCSYCSKIFTRSEHCSRHKLSHTNQRPFACRFCDRSYARKDLVRRHEKTIHVDLYNALSEPTGSCRANKNSTSGVDSSPHNDRSSTLITETSPTVHEERSILRTRTDTHHVESRALFAQGSAGLDRLSSTSQPNSPSSLTSPASSSSSVLTKVFSNTSQDYTFPNNAPQLRRRATTQGDFVPILHAFEPMGNTNRSGETHGTHQCSSISLSDRCDFDLTDELELLPHAGFSGANNSLHSKQVQSYQVPQLSSNDSTSNALSQEHQRLSGQPLFSISSTSMGGGLPTFDLTMDAVMGGVNDDLFFQHMMQQQNLWSTGEGIIDGEMNFLDSLNLRGSRAGSTTPSGLYQEQLESTEPDKPSRADLPTILKEKSEIPPTLNIDETAFQALCNDAYIRLNDDQVKLPIRTRREMQYFWNAYLTCFHRHLPFLHLPSLTVGNTPSPLIFALCCIGALYRLDRQRARQLYNLTRRLLEAELTGLNNYDPTSSETSDFTGGSDPTKDAELMPLWSMQARTLLLLYAILGSDNKIVNYELSRLVMFVIDHRSRRVRLHAGSQDHEKFQWDHWIEVESTKRYLCTIFICSSLLTLIYDLPPGLDITHDLEVQLLDEETLWNANNAEEWQALRGKKSPQLPRRTIRDVMASVITDSVETDTKTAPYFISGFTTLTIIHAVNMYTWSLSQLAFVHNPRRSINPSSTSKELLLSTLRALARCREVLHGASLESIESMWNSPEGPLLLNGEAILRVAYTRLFQAGTMPHGMALFSNTAEQNSKVLAQFVLTEHARGPLITKAMSTMCEALLVPAKAGYLLVQKTAAISWSVEHAVAGWGCIVLLSKWIHSLESMPDQQSMTDGEAEIICQVKSALEGMNLAYEEGTSLAATVVRTYAPLLVDVWVWGITAKMGKILQDLAPIYEANSRRMPPTTDSIGLHQSPDAVATIQRLELAVT